MTTLDLRGTGGTLRLARNGGTATVRSFLVLGPTGPTGPAGAAGVAGPAGPTGPSGPTLPAAQVAALSAIYVRFVDDTTGAQLPSGKVTVKVNATTHDITDIVWEA